MSRKVFLFISDLEVLNRVRTVLKSIPFSFGIQLLDDSYEFNGKEKEFLLITDQTGFNAFRSDQMTYFKHNCLIDNNSTNDLSELESSKTFVIHPKRLIINLSSFIYDLLEEQASGGSFIPIDLESLEVGVPFPGNLFLKLAEAKFVTLFRADSDFDESFYNKFKQEKGIETLYLEKAEFFSPKIQSYLEQIVRKSIESDQEGEFSKLETLYDVSTTLGVSKAVVDSVVKSQQKIVKNVNNSFIKKLLAKFNAMDGSFVFNHSYLTSIFLSSLSREVSWMTSEVLEKLFLSSMLHDIGMKNPRSSLCESLPRAEIEGLDKEIRDDLLKHPVAFIEKMSAINEISSDVLNVLKNHHGGQGEESYPSKSHATEVSGNVAIFILCHELSLALFRISFNYKKFTEVIDNISEVYGKGNFRPHIKVFREHFLKLAESHA